MMSEQVLLTGKTFLFAQVRLAIFPGVFTLLCLVAVVYFIGRRSRAFATFACIAAVMATWMVSARHASRPNSHTLSQRQMMSSRASVVPEPSTAVTVNAAEQPVAWRPEVEERFTPDRYTSMEAALKACARQVGPLIYQVMREDAGEDAKPAEIEVYAELSEEAEPIVASLLAAFPEADVAHVQTRKSRSNGEDVGGGQVYIEVEKQLDDVTEAPWDRTQEAASGTFAISVFGPHGDAKTELRFVEKPWLLNFEEYRQNHPTQRLILSPSLEPDRQVAEGQSADLAVQVLKPIVHDEAKRLVFGQPRFDVEEELPAAVAKGTFVRDQFAQQLRKKNITVWRHAMLVDVKDVKPFLASALANHRTRDKVVRAEQRVTQQRRSFRFGGLIALFASVCGIYWVLDTLTKGYFKGRVAVILAVFGIVGLMLILMVS